MKENLKTWHLNSQHLCYSLDLLNHCFITRIDMVEKRNYLLYNIFFEINFTGKILFSLLKEKRKYCHCIMNKDFNVTSAFTKNIFIFMSMTVEKISLLFKTKSMIDKFSTFVFLYFFFIFLIFWNKLL